MAELHTVGLDIAKSVFQVHGIDAQGRVVARRKLRRRDVIAYFKARETCLIGIEATCGAHHWARVLSGLGHAVRLMPPAYVKAYVKTHKNDANDAEAICEAVGRPTMRFVPVKTEAQQAILALHRTRDLLVQLRVTLVNALRSHLAEFGVVARAGSAGAKEVLRYVESGCKGELPDYAQSAVQILAEQIRRNNIDIGHCETGILAWHRNNSDSSRLTTIPGVGPLTATAIIATVGEMRAFRSSRHFAAWIGLVPRQYSSGGKPMLGRISKRGNTYLRRLLYLCARSVLVQPKRQYAFVRWGLKLREHKAFRVAAVAVANKIARMVWALLSTGETFRDVAPV
jgi:transposase